MGQRSVRITPTLRGYKPSKAIPWRCDLEKQLSISAPNLTHPHKELVIPVPSQGSGESSVG